MIDRIFSRFDRWRHGRQVAELRKRFRRCGHSVSIDLPTVIRGCEHIEIGDCVSINAFVHIWGQGGLIIGDESMIASHVAITTLSHELGTFPYRDSVTSKPIHIGRNVWIGAHAVVLPGVTIGDNAVVGAGAVVTKDVEAGTVVVGVPARLLKRIHATDKPA